MKQHEITVKLGEIEVINRKLEGVDNLQTFTFFLDRFPFAIATNLRNQTYYFLEEIWWSTTLFLNGHTLKWTFYGTEGEMIDKIIKAGNGPVKKIKKQIKKEEKKERKEIEDLSPSYPSDERKRLLALASKNRYRNND